MYQIAELIPGEIMTSPVVGFISKTTNSVVFYGQTTILIPESLEDAPDQAMVVVSPCGKLKMLKV